MRAAAAAAGDAEVVAIDRPPDWMRLAGLAAFDRREPAIPVADLALDTLLPRATTPWAPRLLRFTTGRRSITVIATPHGRSVSLAITVSPSGVVPIDVRPLHGIVRRVTTDLQGAAHCRSVPPGPVSLLIVWPTSAGGCVRTAWTQM